MKTPKRYLVPADYMADPSVHVWDGKLYIYPSHDWESGIAENDNGDHFNMKDYHVFSLNGNDPMTSSLYLSSHTLRLRSHVFPPEGTLS